MLGTSSRGVAAPAGDLDQAEPAQRPALVRGSPRPACAVAPGRRGVAQLRNQAQLTVEAPLAILSAEPAENVWSLNSRRGGGRKIGPVASRKGRWRLRTAKLVPNSGRRRSDAPDRRGTAPPSGRPASRQEAGDPDRGAPRPPTVVLDHDTLSRPSRGISVALNGAVEGRRSRTASKRDDRAPA